MANAKNAKKWVARPITQYEFEKGLDKRAEREALGPIAGKGHARQPQLWWLCPLCKNYTKKKALLPSILMGKIESGSVFKTPHIVCCQECFNIYKAAGGGN